MIRKIFAILSMLLVLHAPAAPEGSSVRVVIDILLKPKIELNGQKHTRSYQEAQTMQRLVWEPWSKFHYRIKETHVLTNAEAKELLKWVQDQINDETPTGWCGHEAEYAITAINGTEISLCATLSAESGSCVYVDGNRPVIGHFHPTKRVLALLTNSVTGEAGTGQPATRPVSKSEGGDKPQPEAEGRSR
jgi:hypothetical protein